MAFIELNYELVPRRADDPIKTAAVEGSPIAKVKGGTNRRSIDFDVDKSKLTGRLFTQSGYGGYLEVGTSRMAPQPYMVPAVERHKGAIAQAIKRHL